VKKDEAPVLTPKQQRFVDGVVAGKTQTQAAMDAGYSWKTAKTTAAENMSKPYLAAEILRRRTPTEEIAKKTEQLRERILSELERMAFANVQDFTRVEKDGNLVADFSNATREQLTAVTKVKSSKRDVRNGRGEIVATEHNAEFSLADKYRGLELLGKTLGMFTEQKVTVTVDVADRLLKARKRLEALSVDAEYEVVGEQSDDDV
jgi:phage terminase small subunit